MGKTKIPLIVSYSEGKILIGESTKYKMENEYKNTYMKLKKFNKEVSYIIEKDSKSNKSIIIVEYYKKIIVFS
jgi:hypothetical protein